LGDVFIMLSKFFNKVNDQEISILEDNMNLNLAVYDYLNAVIKLDIDGNLLAFNQAFAKQYGYNEEDFKKPFLDILLKDRAFEKRIYFEKAFLGKTQTFTATGFPKSGEPLELNITLIPIKNKKNKDIYVVLNDITEFQSQRKELNQFEKMLKVFNEVDYICNYYYDAINDLYYFSKQFTDMFKINSERTFTLSFKHLLRYVHPDDVALVKDTVQSALNERGGFQIDYRIILKNQAIRHVKEKAEILLDSKGNLDGMVGYIQDITDQKNSSAVLEKEKQMKMLYDNPDVGIWSMDVQKGECVNHSKGIESITGYTKDDFNTGLQWSSIIHKDDFEQYLNSQLQLEAGITLQHQYRIINKEGNIKWIQDYTIPTLDNEGNLIRLDGLTLDITEQRLLQEKIDYYANYDALTKLPNNRYKFIEMLEQQIDRYTDNKNQFAVVTLDIDSFRYVNDTVGTKIGDELLKQLAGRITKHLTPNDIIARRGGDEFIILIDNLASISSLKLILNKIREDINEPFHINEYELYITASIGVSMYPENGVTTMELLRNSNLALQYAKREGRNNYHILSYSSSIQSFKNYSIGRDLKKAVENIKCTL